MNTLAISTSSFDIDNNPPLQQLLQKDFRIMSNPHRRKLTEDEIIELLSNRIVGLIAGIEPLTERVFQSAPALKVISRCGYADGPELNDIEDLLHELVSDISRGRYVPGLVAADYELTRKYWIEGSATPTSPSTRPMSTRKAGPPRRRSCRPQGTTNAAMRAIGLTLRSDGPAPWCVPCT